MHQNDCRHFPCRYGWNTQLGCERCSLTALIAKKELLRSDGYRFNGANLDACLRVDALWSTKHDHPNDQSLATNGSRNHQMSPIIFRPSNKKEIRHGRVLWQTFSRCFAMGPLASSIG